MKEINLNTIADGVAKELFAHELNKVSSNIADQNTAALTKRTITLQFTFAPDVEREEVKLTVQSSSKLAAVKSYSKTTYMGKRNGKPTMFEQDQKQMDLIDEGVAPLEMKAVQK